MTTTLDHELVTLLADEYESDIESCIPDLAMDDSDDPFNVDLASMRDTIEDFAADRICDGETHHHHGAWAPEFRAAAQLIARRFCGE